VNGLLQFRDEHLFIETVLETGVRDRVKLGKRTTDAQYSVAEENPDRGWPLTQDLIHRVIGSERSAACHPVILPAGKQSSLRLNKQPAKPGCLMQPDFIASRPENVHDEW
jgi:hypothetical protein